MTEPLNYEIAGIVFSLIDQENHSLPNDLEPFKTSTSPEVRVKVHAAETSSLMDIKGEQVFDSRSTWKIYRAGSQWTFVFQSDSLGESPYQTLSYRKGTSDFEIRSAKVSALPKGSVHPLGHPLSQLLLIAHLSSGKGILLHACGVEIDGRGALFLGSSGAGKSTLAKLFNNRGTLLNDERIAVVDGDPIRIYGTPWHGEIREVNPGSVPLKGVFLIEHGSENRSVPIGGAEAVSTLLAGSRIALWDTDAVEFALEFCRKIVDQIPCYRLSFVPDESAIECVRSLIK